MKTRHFFYGLASAAMMLAGCEANEIKEAPVIESAGSTFELIADIAQTKTTMDANYKVSWEDGDKIYMVTTDGTWGKPWSNENNNIETIAEFTYADGKFTTTAEIEGEKTYTFNAMYCNEDNKTWHRGAGSSDKLVSTQSQDCSDPTAHIGDYDALVGSFEATVPMAGMAEVTMQHIYTLMQVNVKNATGNEISITKFEMTAKEGTNLTGIFNIDFSKSAIESVKTGYGETITVKIENGTVAANESLPVYFVMAPLADYSGDITFKVTDSNGNTYTKTATLNNISFEAGKYNTTPYTISEADEVESDDFDYSETYAIVAYRNAKYYYLTNEETTTSTTRLVAANAGSTIPEDGISLSATKLWKIVKTGVKCKIESISSSEYVDWTSGKNSANMSDGGLEFNMQLAKDKTNAYKFKFIDSESKERYLSLNNTSGSDYFAMYAGTQIDDLYLIPAVVGEEAVPELEGITVKATKTTFTVGDTFSFEGTVTANYSNGTTKDVTTSATFTGYNMSQEGDQTVTVTYEGKTTTYGITVNPAQSGGELEIFKESFGDNSSSAREWSDNYKVQNGVSAVYNASTYIMTNLKQGKNTTGYNKSGINQSSTTSPAYFEVKNLDVEGYSNFKVAYYWKAASVKKTYYTKLYYSTDDGSTYEEVPKDSGTGATSFVEVKYTLPSNIKTSSLSLKVEFYTSNTQAIIDEFVLSATK